MVVAAFLLLMLTITVGFNASLCAAAPAVPGKAPASAAAAAFLRTICNDTLKTNAQSCYDELLPYAESFKGNDAKVAEVAATIFITKVWATLEEMRGVNAKEMDPSLDGEEGGCIQDYEVAACGKDTDLALQSLSLLSYTAVAKERFPDDLRIVNNWMEKAEIYVNQCEMHLAHEDSYYTKLPHYNSVVLSMKIASPIIKAIKT
ncbi:hypothetical protein GUJ93_ZPchr0008g12522 [Zizania palustris]|uniref:Pectinesterase inhibitor domain-containing protein n=1 Tax=Zizania palustris TaxID=103762 RepID=A0A8J5RJ47_ZIZPA|nr:hypothetical protein GUJ93_ZPchr0008g12522 [Zizania palustris]